MIQTLAGTANSPRLYGGRAGSPGGPRGGLLPGEPAAQARARQKNRQKVFCRWAPRAPAARPGVPEVRLAIVLARRLVRQVQPCPPLTLVAQVQGEFFC